MAGSQHQTSGADYVGWSSGDREELGILRTRMSGVERDIRDLNTSFQSAISGVNANIASLAGKFDDRSKVPWQALGVMLTALLAIGALVYWPIRETQGRLVDALDRVQATTVTRSEHEARLNTAAQRRDDIQKLTDSRMDRAERDLSDIEKRIVPRGEHEQTWAAQRARDVDMQRQLEELRRGFNDLYSPKDALARLLQRVDALERELLAARRQG